MSAGRKYLDKMKNGYITMMSHKILTPLTNIKWAAGMLSGNDLVEEKNKGRQKYNGQRQQAYRIHFSLA